MQNTIKFTLVQANLVWENIDANISNFDAIINDITELTDVIILPEMFSTGFSMNTSLAETMQGKTLQWLSKKAAQKNVAICGSLMISENGKFYNRFIWMNPDTTFHKYDKRHCFRMANEQEHFTPGNEKIIINYKGFNICPMVCYDLRFPVWSRNKLTNGKYEYDILLYVANWPQRREFAWKQLLIARAIENFSYVVAVNRVGEDAYQVNYSGNSAILNVLGENVSTLLPNKAGTETIAINLQEIIDFRNQFPAQLDADEFILKL